jgi:hypothetical protein
MAKKDLAPARACRATSRATLVAFHPRQERDGRQWRRAPRWRRLATAKASLLALDCGRG